MTGKVEYMVDAPLPPLPLHAQTKLKSCTEQNISPKNLAGRFGAGKLGDLAYGRYIYIYIYIHVYDMPFLAVYGVGALRLGF